MTRNLLPNMANTNALHVLNPPGTHTHKDIVLWTFLLMEQQACKAMQRAPNAGQTRREPPAELPEAGGRHGSQPAARIEAQMANTRIQAHMANTILIMALASDGVRTTEAQGVALTLPPSLEGRCC